MYCFLKRMAFTFVLCLAINSFAQSIKFSFADMASMPLRMQVLHALSVIAAETNYCAERGSFYFKYANRQSAMCLLQSVDEAPFTLIIDGEQNSFESLLLKQSESIWILKVENNILFDRCGKKIVKMEQSDVAWWQLQELYFRSDFKSSDLVIDEEISRIEKQKEHFINYFLSLPACMSKKRFYRNLIFGLF